MLQRAASNAYSWWWASHIRTKQSKWLEQSLQDMEDKVQHVLKLIEEDGDSFARRAEMYYKKRPELIHFVEESYRAYRALAERYDHISTELQNANTTIASVFPEQVQFAMDEEDEAATPKFPKNPPEISKLNIPKVPKTPARNLKGLITTATKKLQQKKARSIAMAKSGLSKPEALGKIDKLQKEILALQTEKEFVKSSYESGLAKYWEIEKEITEKQEQVSSLQDEFGAGMVIEDDEARKLMAGAALKSCQETIVRLQEKQEISAEETKVERGRIKDVRDKLESLKDEFSGDATHSKYESLKVEGEVESVTEEKQDLELLRAKIKEDLEVGSSASLTVTELAEKVDETVTKVISLETEVASQNALIQILRRETDDLQAQIHVLEDEKAILIGKNSMSPKLREMDEKLNGIQDLNQSIEDQNINLQTHFIEAHCKFDHLAEKLQIVKPDEEIVRTDVELTRKPQSTKPDEEIGVTDSSQTEAGSTDEIVQEAVTNSCDGFEKTHIVKPDEEVSEELNEQDVLKVQDKVDEQTSTQKAEDLHETESQNRETGEEEDEPNWVELFANGLEDREKHILKEYTTVLRNYKDVKKKLDELEKKSQDSLFEMTVQLREWKSTNLMKDEEIRSLRHNLSLLQTSLDGNNDVKEIKASDFLQTSNLLDAPTGKVEDIDISFVDQPQTVSPVEEKFRSNIDELLEENLDFWLRFSTSFHGIQKFQTEVEDLQSEISKLEEKKKKYEGSTSRKHSLMSDVRPLYKHLREIQTELTIWMERSGFLKEELQKRFSSLCNIQEEITKALRASAEDEDFTFTSYQAAKFQGEVLNMKQENNKVADELQAGLDHVTGLQIEIEKTLEKLNEEFGLSGSKNRNTTQLKHSESHSRVPLQSFIFGVKQKSQKPSIFSCMAPALHRRHRGLRPT